MSSKFVLVHSKQGVEAARKRLAADTSPSSLNWLTGQIGGAVLGGLDTALERARNLSTLLGGSIMRSGPIASREPAPAARPRQRFRAPPASEARVTVGIWSLDAWLGSISELIEALNGKQGTFVFYEIEAAVPAGLISRPERVIPWLAEARGKNPDDPDLEAAKATIGDNLIANDFFGVADLVRTDLGLDYIIGITPSMVAGKSEDGSYYTDHFSTYEGRTILASSYELHAFASSSGLSFDAFLTTIIVSELLVATSPRLGYHADTGCLFDYNYKRAKLIDDVRDPKIEPECMELIEPQYRDAARSFVDFIRSIRGVKP